ncbi:MAG: hypothetical protein ACQES4_03085 [Bacillota bacterium]
MNIKKWLYPVLVALMGLVGVILIYASGRIELDPYSLILTLVVAGLALYLYIFLSRNQE